MNLRFYHCNICGKIIAVLSDTDTPTDCCGQAMQELVPNCAGEFAEKHTPVFTQTANTVLVKISNIPHPMTDEHSISWIGIRTAKCFQFRELQPGCRPEANFCLVSGDCVEAVYTYCNLHGLWCSEAKDYSEGKKCSEAKDCSDTKEYSDTKGKKCCR